MSRNALLCLLSTILLFVWSGSAQTRPIPRAIDASAFGERVDISTTWLFSPSDNPANASPTLDDSSWVAVSTRSELTTKGFQSSPICWYRVHVRLPATAHNVVFALESVSGEYQIFANGIQIGGPSAIARGVDQFGSSPINYRIPDGVLKNSTGDLVVALRFAPTISRSQLSPNPMQDAKAYLVSADAAPRDASYTVSHGVVKMVFYTAFSFLLALIALALYLAMRSHREYLAVATYSVVTSLLRTVTIKMRLQPIDWREPLVLTICFAVLLVSVLEFVRLVLSLPRSRFLLGAEISMFLGAMGSDLAFIYPAVGDTLNNSGLWSAVCAEVLTLALLTRACRRRNHDAYILLPLFCMSFLIDFWTVLQLISRHLTHPIQISPLLSLHIGSYVLPFHEVDDLFFDLVLLLFLILRTVRIARERAHATAEIEAAQTTQQLLLARSSQPTPGFAVESVYLPASEVGGDFFLVSPAADGSLTTIVGDVSGKGLTAAMRVAMILGILRREESREPSSILRSLNRALVTQGEVGFTTACCLRLERDGRYRFANAGHIAPYLEGRELEAPPALPLGLADDQTYAELTGHLLANETLVLMSDGIVEARSSNGELYGFDRLPALTRKPAKEIAATAQRFGQEDDITVVTVACTC